MGCEARREARGSHLRKQVKVDFNQTELKKQRKEKIGQYGSRARIFVAITGHFYGLNVNFFPVPLHEHAFNLLSYQCLFREFLKAAYVQIPVRQVHALSPIC